MTKRHLITLLAASILSLLGLPGPVRTQQPQALGEPWKAGVLSLERLDSALEKARVSLAGSQTDASGEEGKLRAALQLRKERLEELIGLVTERDRLNGELSSLPEKRARLEARLATLDGSGMSGDRAVPTVEQMEQLKDELDSQRKALADLTREIRERAERAESIPERSSEYTNRQTAAQQRIRELSPAPGSEKDGAAAKQRAILLGNAEIESVIAKEGRLLLETEEDFEKQAVPYRNRALEFEQKTLADTEQEYARHQKALEGILAARQVAEEQALSQKREAVEQAVTPAEKFLSSWEAQVAAARTAAAQLDSVKAKWERIETEVDKRAQAERNELENLKSLVRETGATGYTAERLKRTVQRIEGRRRAFSHPDSEQLSTHLNQYLDRKFEIDDRLFALNEEWQEEMDRVSPAVPEPDRPAFGARSVEERENLRRALLDERTRLTEVSQLGQQLLRVAKGRKATFEELQAFLLTQLVYIRDAQPLGIGVLKAVPGELRPLRGRAANMLASSETRGLLQGLQTAEGVLVGALVVVLLPALLLYVRFHLRRFVRAQNEASRKDDGRKRRIPATAAAVLDTLLLPAYLVALALFVQVSARADDAGPLFRDFLLYLALFLFLWFEVRAFLGKGAIARVQFGLRADTAATLHRCSNLVLLAYLFLLIPWLLLREPPFALEALPRVFYTLFEIAVALAIALLVRPTSPLVRDLNGAPTSARPSLAWRVVFFLSLVLPVVVLVMDVLGYRYGASYLALNAILSLVTGLVLVGIYRVVLPLAESLMRSRKPDLTGAPGEDVTLEAPRVELQTKKFLRALFVLLGIVAFAFYWDIDRSLLKAMDSISLYDIRSGNEIVESTSLRDLLQAIAVLFLAGWILKNLPGIYELTFFSRYEWDPGIRYAFLTMSRYGVLFVGFLIALSSIHLDLSRIGLVMAALGVGLGFGLQEIVSNFVSGLILLVERPVRVNDIVSVGQMTGEVKRINIRATTIVNWDRQEVIIPNKDFITKEVTNWTLADKTLRLVVRIGVAYGSDVDQVRSILLDVAARQPEVLKDPAPQALFLNHGDSALEFEVRAFVPQPRLRFMMMDRLNSEINKEFAAHGINIPFPQRDLHIRTPASGGAAALLGGGSATARDAEAKGSTDERDKAASG